MKTMISRNDIRLHRKKRILARGTAVRPRISVYRSLTSVYAQLIDDEQGKTIVAVNTQKIKKGKSHVEAAKEAGKLLAKKAQEKGITQVVFDRAGYKYHGKVKALAEGAREGGLKF